MELINGLNILIGRSVRKSIFNPLVLAVLFLLAASSLGQTNDGSASSPSLLTTASFQPIGQGPKGSGSLFSRAWGVSDGAVVGSFVTLSADGVFLQTHAFRWTEDTGFQDLGMLNPHNKEGEAYAVSDDGSKVVGWSTGVSGYQRPFLWTAASGMQELSKVPGTDAYASGISNDGSVIVGAFYVDGEGWHAFRWNGKNVTDLGFLKKGHDKVKVGGNSKGEGVCGLGTAVVGSTVDSSGIQTAFRWQKPKMQNLGGVGTNNLAYAEDCSDDGSVVVGTSMDNLGNLLATRWSPTKILSLGTLGGDMSESHGSSADGSIVVGGAGLPFVNGISQFSAFRWSSATGMEQLSKVLENLLGVDKVQFCHQVPCAPGTWFIDLAMSVSTNGAVIVGTTWDPNFPTPYNVEAFRAVVPVAP
jgi:probable HAF family extracellular repeat protein